MLYCVCAGILSNESHRLLDRTLLDQAYAVLERVGPNGMSQVALGSALGMDKLLSRSILRNLTRLKKVTVFMKDEKKQRTARFVNFLNYITTSHIQPLHSQPCKL